MANVAFAAGADCKFSGVQFPSASSPEREDGPRADWCPARADAVHAAEARLISEHDAKASTAPGSGPPGFFHSIRKAVFF
jgi:hypothetical protein